MAGDEVPIDLYLAAYTDADAAQQDWDDLRRLAKDKVVSIDAMVLVRRDEKGSIHVKDTGTGADIGVGAAVGAVGGVLIGLIFPPSLLAAAAVGAGIGAGTGAVVDQVTKHAIKADLDTLPPDTSAIVAVFEERWVAEVEKALAKADKTDKHHVHDDGPADAAATPATPAAEKEKGPTG
jgi:uncharacterized membrane protein